MNARLADLVRVARELIQPRSLPAPADLPPLDELASPESDPSITADERALLDFRNRFHGLRELALQSRGPTSAPLVSEKGAASQIELRWLTAGPGVQYVLAIDARQPPKAGAAAPLAEWLWPTERLPSTDIIYDCTDEVLHGKAKPILCDLSKIPVRVLAIAPTQVERVQLKATQQVAPNGGIRFSIEFQDAGGRAVKGRLPFEWSIGEAGKSEAGKSGAPTGLYALTGLDGTYADRVIAFREKVGTRLVLTVRSQLNGLTAELPVSIIADAPKGDDQTKLTDEQVAITWNPRPYQWASVERPSAKPPTTGPDTSRNRSRNP